ncbi:tol-pal system protein YbgF [Pseudaminobacter arsenicus]|uniref:Cell division coordinator CpoB n=1 Tax=Borborobacter arsenicus TaxID=1851146 RepID=A0A432V0Q4_9HYPH|nr:tol-pal system protein YbgF [Pseudaminobacter arsenicus]RUM95678.1 tol-pal system protein YbgF [Pseudaminobacter arsenicus]
MYFRSILSGTLAVLLLSGAAIARDSAPAMNEVQAARPGLAVPVPSVGLPGVFGSAGEVATIQMAQAGDPRVTALEEQIRSLNGTIEELNFQILQMQEQMRKMQEDNEFRFQELEKRSDAKGGRTNRSVAENSASPSGSKAAAPADSGQTASTSQSGGVEQIIQQDGAAAAQPDGTGEPPRTFGTITFDANGNVVGGAPGNATASPEPENTTIAALPTTDDPDELYRNSYQFILSGDYGTAEAGFRDHIARFPKDAKAADSHFWLGEALLGQQKYRDAAEVFLAANKDYPKSKKAPEMLLKLGVSLVGLNQRDVACATFNEVGKRYPNVSGALKERVKQEKALAAC